MAKCRTKDLTATLPGQVRALQANRPIIFLDIDDVLCVYNTFNSRDVLAALSGDSTVNAEEVLAEVFHPVACYYLRELHDEFKPLYVISSSWTLHLDREQLCKTFLRTGLDFVAHNLHSKWRTVRTEGGNRRSEIEGWLEDWLQAPTLVMRPPVLIIDDLRSGLTLFASPLASVTVFCADGVGFTFRELRDARGVLRNQLKQMNMVEYQFTLVFDISDCIETTEEIVARLSDSGITDAVVVPGQRGQVALTFSRDAVSLEDAQESALKAVFIELPCSELIEA